MTDPDITAAAREWVNVRGPNLTPGEELGDRELEAAFAAGAEWAIARHHAELRTAALELSERITQPRGLAPELEPPWPFLPTPDHEIITTEIYPLNP